MLRDGVIVAVVNHAELPQHVTPDNRLDRPVVTLLALALAIQPLHVQYLRAKPFEDYTDVLDA